MRSLLLGIVGVTVAGFGCSAEGGDGVGLAVREGPLETEAVPAARVAVGRDALVELPGGGHGDLPGSGPMFGTVDQNENRL